jgi:secreted Zn-dependent insulinase-like peptidase
MIRPFATTLVKHALMTRWAANNSSFTLTDCIRYLRRLVDDALTEEVYNASLAGLSYSLNTDSEWNLELETRGYNDKMIVLLKLVLEKVRSHVVDEDRFAVYQTEVCTLLRRSIEGNIKTISDSTRIK